MKAPLVLASSSPRRRRLLRELGVAFSVRQPEVDERPLPGELPGPHVRRLALAKARAVARGLVPGCGVQWVLGADTVVVLDGQILGKPRDAGDAAGMLARLSGRAHEVLTGVALLPATGGRARTAVVRSRVEMRPFDESAIRRYVAGGEPLDKAGSYAVQGEGRHLVARVSGSLTNVVGLPLERLARLLAEAGVTVASGEAPQTLPAFPAKSRQGRRANRLDPPSAKRDRGSLP